MNWIRICILAITAGSPTLFSQAVLSPWINQQFTDQAGRALSGGKVYTCIAGASCPGSPLATYTTSSGLVANSNPVTLDASGRAAIWLAADTAYRFVITNALGAVVTGAGGDNIIGGSGGSGGGGGGGGGSSQWTTSGSNIYYSAGNVYVGATTGTDRFEVLGISRFRGAVRFANNDATPRYIELSAPAGMASSYSLTLPGTLADGCLSNTAGAINFVTCGSGGGTGANNYSQSFTAQTSVALTHNLNSNAVLIDCYTAAGSPVRIPQSSITSITLTTVNTATVVFGGSTSGHCVVNRSAGNPNLWSLTGTDVNLSSSSYNLEIDATMKVSSDNTFDIGTASGASRTAPRTIYASTEVEAPVFRTTYTSGGSVADYFDWTAGPSSTNAWVIKDSSSVVNMAYNAIGVTPSFVFRGTLLPNSTTTYDLGASALRWNTFYVKDVNISGTCTGCGGGGGLPVSDAISVVTGSSDATKQLRFEVDGFTASTIRVLTPQNSSYTLAGTNISQTFSADQTLAANLLISGARNIGTSAAPVNLNYSTQSLAITDSVCTSSSYAACFRIETVPSSNALNFLDPSNAVRFQIDALTSPGRFMTQGHILPITRNTTDVGQAFPFEFRNAYFAGTVNGDSGFKVGANTVIDSSRNGSFANVTISGICTGCPGGGGVSSVTIAGTASQITASGTCTITTTGTCTLSIPNNPSFTGQISTTNGVQIGTSGSLLQGITTRLDGSGNGSFANVNLSGAIAQGFTTRIDGVGNGIFRSLQVTTGNVDIPTGGTFSVGGSFFGIDRAGGTITFGGCTLFFKSGILYGASGC